MEICFSAVTFVRKTGEDKVLKINNFMKFFVEFVLFLNVNMDLYLQTAVISTQ